MKKLIYFLIAIVTVVLVYNYREEILVIYNEYYGPVENKVSKLEKNQYSRNYDYSYVQNTTNFIPNNKTDIRNIYYTIINSGMTNFTFYCPSEYKTCKEDVKVVANDQYFISNLSNFVHPYNSANYVNTVIDSLGKIHVEVEKSYSEQMKIIVDYKVDEIYKKVIGNNNYDNTTKIKMIHDYIINNTKYDKDRTDNKIIKYHSDSAYGVLIENYGICGGYTDAMMLFLEKMGIESIKVASDNHIWNYVKLDNKWLHLDLTWDDPISPTGEDILDYSYFLIKDSELKEIEKLEHNYDESVYKN